MGRLDDIRIENVDCLKSVSQPIISRVLAGGEAR